MKRSFSLLLFVLLFISQTSIVFAAQTPLDRDGRAAYVAPQSPVSLLHSSIYLRIRPGASFVSLSAVLRNDGIEDMDFLMGMPTQFGEFSVVENLSASFRREPLRMNILRNTEDLPPRWHTWTIPMLSGETVVVDSVFSLGNMKTPLGGEVVVIPISYLAAFSGPVQSLDIVADLDLHGPYAFHPAPSIMPNSYAHGGRLVFSLNGFDTQTNLTISYIPLSVAVPQFIIENTPDSPEIAQIIQLYRARDLDRTISTIMQFLVANEDFPLRRELYFLEALSSLELGRMDVADDIFARLEHRTGFTGDLADAVRQKIIFERSALLTSKGRDSEALEYLKGIELPDLNDVFAIWHRDEIRRLTPPPPEPEPIVEPVPEPVAVEPEIIEEAPEEDGLTIDVSPEIMIAIAVILILLLIIVLRRKPKKRKYYFN